MDRHRCGWLLFSAAAAVLCGAAVWAAEDDPAVRDFGTDRGEPIHTGFFFYEGTYIDAPYIVERRGLHIYVNNVLVRKGMDWPPRDYRVKDDPGDPPPGSSPLAFLPEGVDPATTYWSRKWVYLFTHFDEATARAKMIEAYRKCGAFREVTLDRDGPRSVVTVDHSGRRIVVTIAGPSEWMHWPPDKQKYLAPAEEGKRYYESILKAGVLLSRVDCGEMIAGTPGCLQLLEVLISDTGPQEKLKMLLERGMLKRADDRMAVIATRFQAGPQLKERVARLREDLKKAAETKAEARAARRLLARVRRADPLTDPGSLAPEPPSKASAQGPSVQAVPGPQAPGDAEDHAMAGVNKGPISALDRLRSGEPAVRRQAEQELVGNHRQTIAALQALIEENLSQYNGAKAYEAVQRGNPPDPKHFSAGAAIRILGEMRSAESVPLLVKHLHLYLPVRPKGLRDTPGPGDFPAAEALIRIGLPALRPVLEKYAKEAHGPRMLPFWIVEGVLGPRLAGAFVKNVAAEERDPQKKKWLQELADAFGGGS